MADKGQMSAGDNDPRQTVQTRLSPREHAILKQRSGARQVYVGGHGSFADDFNTVELG